MGSVLPTALPMKATVLIAVFVCPWLVLPSHAQNLPGSRDEVSLKKQASAGVMADSEKAEGTPAEDAPLMASQNAATLESGLGNERRIESVVDLAVLRSAVPPGGAAAEELERISATYRESGKPETDCRRAAMSVEQRIRLVPSDLLEIVETEISANPQCGCEIVKSAIFASNAEIEEVVGIVETAILAAPETMRMVSQCAIAASPDSLAAIQALLARFDANAGEGDSAKSAKSAKGAKDAVEVIAPEDEVAPGPNPLDFPGVGPVGPSGGGPGGQPLIPPLPPIITPPVTSVDP